MRDVQKLRDLLERVSAASGPDLLLDIDCADVFGSLESYSYSLDASVGLVERMLPGATYSIDNITGPEARIYLDAVEWEFEAEAVTLPLAILSALLRALISQAEGEAQHG